MCRGTVQILDSIHDEGVRTIKKDYLSEVLRLIYKVITMSILNLKFYELVHQSFLVKTSDPNFTANNRCNILRETVLFYKRK